MTVLTGCSTTGLTTYHAVMTENAVRIPVHEYPELRLPDGAIQLDVGNLQAPIIVIRTSENSFVALSPVCMHLGCIARKESAFFRCPCHGSTYELNGTVVRGPAEQPLRTFKTEYDGKTLVIHL